MNQSSILKVSKRISIGITLSYFTWSLLLFDTRFLLKLNLFSLFNWLFFPLTSRVCCYYFLIFFLVLRLLINLIRGLIFTFYWVCLFCRKTFRHFIWQYMWSYRFLLLSQLFFDCFYTERCIMKIKQCKEDRIYLCTIHKGYTFLGYLRSTLRPLTWFSLFFKEKNHIYPPKYLPCYKNFRRPTK